VRKPVNQGQLTYRIADPQTLNLNAPHQYTGFALSEDVHRTEIGSLALNDQRIARMNRHLLWIVGK
jgi:hypothetical protein